MTNSLYQISKFLSLVLRHKPAEIDLQLDKNGWAGVEELIEKMNQRGFSINKAIINEIVDTNDKRRFAFNEDKTMIRASQGHSLSFDLNLAEATPPDILYHGTSTRFLESIFKNGLQKQSRQHVHLSTTIQTASAVGARHGKPVILIVNAKAMLEAGHKFYLSANKVWLTDFVPVSFITQ
jgi:putative RNA 2'-phosphotransferase